MSARSVYAEQGVEIEQDGPDLWLVWHEGGLTGEWTTEAEAHAFAAGYLSGLGETCKMQACASCNRANLSLVAGLCLSCRNNARPVCEVRGCRNPAAAEAVAEHAYACESHYTDRPTFDNVDLADVINETTH